MSEIIKRRIIWMTFLGIFIICIPIIFSQALGYKYNWTKNKFEATGILYIKTYPRNVDIWLNDKLIEEKTPCQKAKLLPGTYNLKINKTGYLPWEKNIRINERQTTFIEDVVLYKQLLPTPITKLNLTDYLTNDNYTYLFLDKNDTSQKLIRYNTNNQEWQLLKEWPLSQKIKLISLSLNNNKLIYTDNGSYRLLLTEYPDTDVLLTGLSNIYWQNIVWQASSDNILYTKVNKRLYEINISTPPVQIVATQNNVIDYFSHKENIFWLETNEQESQLTLYQADKGFKNKEAVILMPYTTDIEYLESDNLLTLLDKVNHFLYLIKLNGNDLIVKVIPNVNQAKWYPNNYDKILYWNNNELYVYYIGNEKSQLITRLSQPIEDAWWHPNGSYAFYQQDKKISIIEFDSRDKKNSYEIVTLKNETPFIVNKKGDKIIYYVAEEKTLYEQSIQ